MAMVRESMQQALDAMQARVVFGEPIEQNGTIFLPAAKVRGGGGGGGDTEGNGGAGFGITAKPAGVFVIRDGDAEWEAGAGPESRDPGRPAGRDRGLPGAPCDLPPTLTRP